MALRIRESVQDIYHAGTDEAFSLLLSEWDFWATHSRLEPIIRAAITIKRLIGVVSLRGTNPR